MILLWNHSHGKHERQDLVVCHPLAIPESWEESEMIENGWLALDRPVYVEGRWQEVFYQSRSTRFRLRKHHTPHNQKPLLYKGKTIQMMEIVPEKNFLRWTGLQKVYDTYLKRTGFRNKQNPLTHISERDTFILYYIDEITNLIGFTKIKRYWYQEELLSLNHTIRNREQIKDDCMAIESVIHANTVPIAKTVLEMELAWAKRKNASYFYMGSGYERSSIYRSTMPGFQWWTGVTWSSSCKQYQKLCERDSKTKIIRDIKN
jgi:hypothetical protein